MKGVGILVVMEVVEHTMIAREAREVHGVGMEAEVEVEVEAEEEDMEIDHLSPQLHRGRAMRMNSWGPAIAAVV